MTTALSNTNPAQPTCSDCGNSYDERFGGAGRCHRCLKTWSAQRAEASSHRRFGAAAHRSQPSRSERRENRGNGYCRSCGSYCYGDCRTC